MNMLNELQTMSATKVRVLGLTFGTGLALALIGSFEYGKRTTRKLYEARINELEIERMKMAKGANEASSAMHIGGEQVLPTDDDQAEADVSLLPKFNVHARMVVTEISNDLTSDLYTSPGISLEDAGKLLDGELTIGDNTSFEIPEGGLWVVGRMIGGSDEDRDIHDKAVQAALAAKVNTTKPKRTYTRKNNIKASEGLQTASAAIAVKREKKKDRIEREKREAREMKEVE